MANRRTPTAMRILAGNPANRPLPENEPKATGVASVPGWLTADARAVWEDLAPGLARMGVLCEQDGEQFGVLCGLIAEYRRSPAEMVTSRIGLMRGLFAEFGMGPAARARISVKPAEQGDDESRFFGPKSA